MASRRTPDRRVLMIALHFPPIQGSSGVHRTLGFVRHLPASNWHPWVLTANARAYGQVDEQNLGLLPEHANVTRAFALNTQKHLSIAGRYPSILALPDVWQSWILGGLASGLSLIRRHDFKAIVSTYPVASAHILAYLLHRLSKLPWVADLRDPMVQGTHPSDPWVRRIHSRLEQRTFRHASGVTVVTPGTRKLYEERYPDYPADRLHIISNGYDEDAFSGLTPFRNDRSPRPLTLLHSGLMYPSERDPTYFFDALAYLKRERKVDANSIQVKFRAAGNEPHFRALVQERNLQDIVHFLPPLDYRSALQEILSEDVLLVCQGQTCNDQIPAKVYEYLFARKPILGLCDPKGDTGALLASAGCPYVVPLESEAGIRGTLSRLISDYRGGRAWVPTPDQIAPYSRAIAAKQLGAVLDDVTSRAPVNA
jgi:glycosyltransferase involved in cell wall biosynthesis